MSLVECHQHRDQWIGLRPCAFGNITTQSILGSNVIVARRAYPSKARVVTIANQMLQPTVTVVACQQG